jgi:single-strand DNA-binding protein
MHDQPTTAEDDTVAVTNLAVLRGCVRSEPVVRLLPSGGTVLQFDLATAIVADGRTATFSVPVSWPDPGAAASLVADGAELVVIGSVRRRFFRVGGATQSRTEVVADAALPIRRRKRVAAALDRVVERLVIS